MDYEYNTVKTKLSIINNSYNVSAITSLLKTTPLSRNITIEMWNSVIEYMISFITSFKNVSLVCTMLNEFMKYLDERVEDSFPARLDLLEDIPEGTSNSRITLTAIVNDTPSKITLDELQKRVIRTSNTVPDDLQVGQYLFKEIE